MKAPSFWFDKKSFWSIFLKPLGEIYHFLSWISKIFSKTQKVTIPVICIGNLTLGGAGKTPTSIKIAELLIANGYRVSFLSRGYKGKIKKPTKVNLKKHTYTETGDEPLLLAKTAPTWISKNRKKGALEIVKENKTDIIILDDGFQNTSIYKDLSIIVVDGPVGFGNECIFPAGPLRQSLSSGINKADIFLIIGNDTKLVQDRFFKDKNTFLGKIETSLPKYFSSDKKYIAFAGIGRPKKFFDSLKTHKINTIKEISFPDHYSYKKRDIEQLINISKQTGTSFITTTKDHVKLPSFFKKQIEVVSMAITIDNEKALIKYLKEKLNL